MTEACLPCLYGLVASIGVSAQLAVLSSDLEHVTPARVQCNLSLVHAGFVWNLNSLLKRLQNNIQTLMAHSVRLCRISLGKL